MRLDAEQTHWLLTNLQGWVPFEGEPTGACGRCGGREECRCPQGAWTAEVAPPAWLTEAAKPCSTCGGRGRITYQTGSSLSVDDPMLWRKPCPDCRDGRRPLQIEGVCPVCCGTLEQRMSGSHDITHPCLFCSPTDDPPEPKGVLLITVIVKEVFKIVSDIDLELIEHENYPLVTVNLISDDVFLFRGPDLEDVETLEFLLAEGETLEQQIGRWAASIEVKM